MGFWWMMLGCDLLVPAVLLIGGYGMWKHGPKEMLAMISLQTAALLLSIIPTERALKKRFDET